MNEFIRTLLGNPAINLAAVLLLLTAAAGVGSGALRLLVPQHRPALPAALTLGLSLLAWPALAAAPWLLALPTWAVWLLLIPGAIGGGMAIRRAEPLKWLRDHWPEFLVIMLLVMWFGGSTILPPFSWDEQTYQLALPVRWLAGSDVRPTADVPYSGFPLLPQFLVLILLKMGGLSTARMLILALFGVLFLMLFHELRRHLDRVTAVVFTAVFALSPLVLAMIREFYAEIFLALPLLAAWQLRRQCPEDAPPWRRGIIFGILAGAAAAVKLTGAGTSLAILLLALPPGIFRRGGGAALLRFAAVFAAAAAVMAAPFYLRPFLAFGNPFYPFLSSFFGAPSAELEAYHHAMGDHRYGIGRLPGIVYSWLFTAFYDDIYDGILTGWPFALCCLAGVIFCYLAWRRQGTVDREYLLLGGVSLLLYLFWCVTAQQTRFMLPLYPLIMIFAGIGLGGWGKRLRIAAMAFMIVGAALSFDWYAFRHGLYSWMLWNQTLKYPAEVLARAMRGPDMLYAYQHLLQQTPRGTRVLLVFDRRALYCPRPSRNGTPGFQEWIDWGTDPQADLMPKLREHRIDCILLNSLERNPDQLETARVRDIALAEQLRGAIRRGDLIMEEIPDCPDMLLLRVRKH